MKGPLPLALHKAQYCHLFCLFRFLFTLYTNDCRGTNEAPIIKYSDDSAIFDLSNDDSHYFTEVSKFTEWCEANYLMLNVSKSKLSVIYFHQKPAYLSDLLIKGEKVERVRQYMYLGTTLDSKLNFDQNTALIQKNCNLAFIYCKNLRI